MNYRYSFTQGGGEYALPWARYQALSGRLFGKTVSRFTHFLQVITEPPLFFRTLICRFLCKERDHNDDTSFPH